MNFDFGRRWSEVEPYLTTPEMRLLLERCWTEMLADKACYSADGYKHDRAPASQITSGDGSYYLIDERVHDAIDHGHPKLPTDMKAPPSWASYEEPSKELVEQEEQYYEDVKRAIGLDFLTNPNHVVHWAAAYGSSHWFNPHIGLHLAARVCPSVQWTVLRGVDHTTVVSSDGYHVFDLLAWAWDRLDAVMIGDERVEDDPTLGGAVAVDMASTSCQRRKLRRRGA